MKTHSNFIFLLMFALSGCVAEYNKPWVEKADSLVGKNLTTACAMMVVERGDHHLLVPVSSETRRFTQTTGHQRVVANIPVGSKVRMKKRTFRISKPGRDDYLVVDVITSSGVHRDILLIAGSLFLTDKNFVDI